MNTKRKIDKTKKIWLLLIVVMTIMLSGCLKVATTTSDNYDTTYQQNQEEAQVKDNIEVDEKNKVVNDKVNNSKGSKAKIDEEAKIHFIDVGQGDCVLIQQGHIGMLIDAGDNGSGKTVVTYIKKIGIERLSYVIGTHPHEDHVGGLDYVINNIPVETVILPNFSLDTKTYKDVLQAIDKNNLKITLPVLGDEFKFGDGVFTIIAPVKEDYGDNANNYSVGIKYEFDGNTFVSVGDAEIEVEKDILGIDIPLEADLYKVSHHGSDTSNSKEFLKAVDPIYGVISVGEGNSYGHPYYSVLSLLEDEDIQLYRTDKNGTVIATLKNGDITMNISGDRFEQSKNIDKDSMKNEKDKFKVDNDIDADVIVYKTKTGTKYHKEGCVHLSKSKIELTLSEALLLKYEPCNICYPK